MLPILAASLCELSVMSFWTSKSWKSHPVTLPPYYTKVLNEVQELLWVLSLSVINVGPLASVKMFEWFCWQYVILSREEVGQQRTTWPSPIEWDEALAYGPRRVMDLVVSTFQPSHLILWEGCWDAITFCGEGNVVPSCRINLNISSVPLMKDSYYLL